MLFHSEKVVVGSKWLLLLVGGSFAITVPNLNSISEIVSMDTIHYYFTFSIISAICGGVQMLFGNMVRMRLQLANMIEKDLNIILKSKEQEENQIHKSAEMWQMQVDTSLSIQRVITEVLCGFPRWIRKKAIKGTENGSKDPLRNFKDASREAVKQSYWFIAQVLFLLTGYLILTFNIQMS